MLVLLLVQNVGRSRSPPDPILSAERACYIRIISMLEQAILLLLLLLYPILTVLITYAGRPLRLAIIGQNGPIIGYNSNNTIYLACLPSPYPTLAIYLSTYLPNPPTLPTYAPT